MVLGIVDMNFGLGDMNSYTPDAGYVHSDILKSISPYMNCQNIAINNQDVLANSKNKFPR